VRFQRGLADRFRRGLIRSGAVLAEIKRILSEYGVPADLAYLPHVESSFNLRTYSKFGAAGIWQFTRGTGRKFLTVRYEVDERLDPILSTYAAAKFLRANYERLGSWPLAITAYNHGPQGIDRIVTRKGTRDLATLIKTCDCRLFKFASKNFYAEFLAARQVAKRFQDYFGPLELEPQLAYSAVELPFYLDFERAIDVLGVDEEVLRNLNPSLRTPVIVGAKLIPKGYRLRLPAGVAPARFVSMVPPEEQHKKQKLTEVVRVRRGDTLYDLGRRYNVPWSVIARANQITAYHRIRPGQRLVIPRRAKGGRKWIARAPPTPEPKPARKAAVRPPPEVASVLPVSARPSEPASSIAFQRAEGAALFQDLEVQRLTAGGSAGEIIAAYGETLGHYAAWAGVSTQAIRRRNRFGYGSLLQPGRRVAVPFVKATLEAFTQNRFEYHRGREEDFFSTYAVTELVQVKVRRGDSVWDLAQSNNVPMWLFYQQNPRLVNTPIRAGMIVGLPVIDELATLREAKAGENGTAVQ
jgi:membrane-bound lytic murein transglycosylase D